MGNGLGVKNRLGACQSLQEERDFTLDSAECCPQQVALHGGGGPQCRTKNIPSSGDL